MRATASMILGTMTATMPAPANLEDGYLLYLAALRETRIANLFDARVTVDTTSDAARRTTGDIPPRWAWAFPDRQLQP